MFLDHADGPRRCKKLGFHLVGDLEIGGRGTEMRIIQTWDLLQPMYFHQGVSRGHKSEKLIQLYINL